MPCGGIAGKRQNKYDTLILHLKLLLLLFVFYVKTPFKILNRKWGLKRV